MRGVNLKFYDFAGGDEGTSGGENSINNGGERREAGFRDVYWR